jgi:hypothetical protein
LLTKALTPRLGTTLQGNGTKNGAVVVDKASVQLENCTSASNEGHYVLAASGATVNLVHCSVTDSLRKCGLRAFGKGTCAEANDTAFQGNCLSGVDVSEKASLQLKECTVAGNKRSNVEATHSAAVERTSCRVAGSLEQSGLMVDGDCTCVKANDTTFQWNCLKGVAVEDKATVHLPRERLEGCGGGR